MPTTSSSIFMCLEAATAIATEIGSFNDLETCGSCTSRRGD
ncbi:hypothetical protein A2U01_0072634, partial [Trifolium medium]|nr:hypothetical protein [Trifolium medium]